MTLTADLHSMGQYIQEGERTLFETIISVARPASKVVIEADSENLDGLNYLAGKRISEVNRMAELGVQLAHVDGGVPNLRVEIPEISAEVIGSLLYFFEKACGISGYLLGVNPFDQPGVEAYKKNMFALLEKPGYEEATKGDQGAAVIAAALAPEIEKGCSLEREQPFSWQPVEEMARPESLFVRIHTLSSAHISV